MLLLLLPLGRFPCNQEYRIAIQNYTLQGKDDLFLAPSLSLSSYISLFCCPCFSILFPLLLLLLSVGKILAAKGVIDHYSVDFLAVPNPQSSIKYDLFALEINIRQGGVSF